MDEGGNVCHTQLTDARVNDWQPYRPGDPECTPLTHTVITKLETKDIAPGNYRLGLWIPDGSERLKYNPRYAIRCANSDTEWKLSDDGKYGINVLTTLKIN